ncbi:MAG: glycosyltransferase [Flavobacteriaceae bacterium]
MNDGSKDNQALIETICQRNDAFHFISFKENRGLSAAIKAAGFDHAESNLVGYIDSDLQTAPEDFNLLLQHIGEYDLVTDFR